MSINHRILRPVCLASLITFGLSLDGIAQSKTLDFFSRLNNAFNIAANAQLERISSPEEATQFFILIEAVSSRNERLQKEYLFENCESELLLQPYKKLFNAGKLNNVSLNGDSLIIIDSDLLDCEFNNEFSILVKRQDEFKKYIHLGDCAWKTDDQLLNRLLWQQLTVFLSKKQDLQVEGLNKFVVIYMINGNTIKPFILTLNENEYLELKAIIGR